MCLEICIEPKRNYKKIKSLECIGIDHLENKEKDM